MEQQRDITAERGETTQERAEPSDFERLLQRPTREPTFVLVDADMQRAWQLAEAIFKAGWGPKGMGQPALYCAIIMGAELGIPAMTAVQNIAVVNGRPQVWGDMPLALCQRSGLIEWIEEHEIKDEAGRCVGATCVVKRRGWPKPVTRYFDRDRAEKAGLAKKSGSWQEYDWRMYQMRARGFALRDSFPDVLRGVDVAEAPREEEPPVPDRVDENRAREITGTPAVAARVKVDGGPAAASVSVADSARETEAEAQPDDDRKKQLLAEWKDARKGLSKDELVLVKNAGGFAEGDIIVARDQSCETLEKLVRAARDLQESVE